MAGSSQLTIPEASQAALKLLRAGKLAQATQLYRRILQASPDHVDALHYLGLALFQSGQHDEAIALVTRAVNLAPDYVDAHNNLGNMLVERGRQPEAEAIYRQILSLHPRRADARVNLGALLARRDERAGAEAEFRRAIVDSPDLAEAYVNLGMLLKKGRRLAEALTMFQRALALRPQEGAGYRRVGGVLQSLGRIDDAAAIYAKWSAAEPNNPAAKHLLASCTGQDVPARATDEFVQDTFDAFADSFDQVLDKLHYRAPALILDAVTATLGDAAATLDILDAGAGTGWCGPLLKPFARRLVGVDLSSKMLAKATARAVYDALHVAELVAYLRGQVAAFDLVVSADTLVYFGELSDALAAAAAALRPGGHLIFTVERADDEPGSGYRLNPHGRYSHSEAYVRRALADAALTPVALTRVHLRLQARVPVEGLLVVAQAGSKTTA